MFRENEASRVGAVLEHKVAGDLDGMLEAAVAVWLQLPEREGPDSAEREVWDALVEKDLVARAAELGATLIRGRQRLRPAAFVHVVEALDPSGVLELAAHVVAAGWPAQPYLAALLACAIDDQQETAVAAFLRAHTNVLATRTDTWILVGFVYTCSRVGKHDDLVGWFENWHVREGVPTWLVAAYAVAIRQQFPSLGRAPRKSLAAAAGLARRHAVPDVTTAFFSAILLIESVIIGDLDEFARELEARRAELTAFVQTPVTEYPVVRYANIAREVRPVGAVDLAWVPPERREIRLEPRPTHWFMAVPIRDLRDYTTRASTILGVFERMLKLHRGDPAVIELCREMERSRPSSLPALKPAWKRLVRARTTFGQRLELMFA